MEIFNSTYCLSRELFNPTYWRFIMELFNPTYCLSRELFNPTYCLSRSYKSYLLDVYHGVI